MATTQIKSANSDNQALVDSTGHLYVTSGGGGGPPFNVNITEVGGAALTLGQNLMANSLPVAIASDQSPIPVTFSSPNTTIYSTYMEVTSVPVGVETTIVTYTAPAGKTTYLLLVSAAGQNISDFIVYNGASVVDKMYSSYTAFNVEFDFRSDNSGAPGLPITAGNIISVTVNQAGQSSASFNARIQVLVIG